MSNKRSRAELEDELTLEKEKKHRAQKRARVLKKELAELNATEAKARGVKIPWTAFIEEGPGKSTLAWKEVTSKTLLRWNKDDGCIGEDGCFYSNYSRSQGAEKLFQIDILGTSARHGSLQKVYVCDYCYKKRDSLLEEHLPDYEWVVIDPNDYEPERMKAMLEYKEE